MTPRCPRRAAVTDDTGSTLILTICFGALALVLTLLLVAATSLYLERKRLFTLADGAALAGAEAFDLDAVTVTDGRIQQRLESPGVREAVDAYLAEGPADEFEGLTVLDATSPDGLSATVTLRSAWRPPVLTAFVPDGLAVEVTAVARSVFW